MTTLGSPSHAINSHLEIEGYGGLGAMPESVFFPTFSSNPEIPILKKKKKGESGTGKLLHPLSKKALFKCARDVPFPASLTPNNYTNYRTLSV